MAGVGVSLGIPSILCVLTGGCSVARGHALVGVVTVVLSHNTAYWSWVELLRTAVLLLPFPVYDNQTPRIFSTGSVLHDTSGSVSTGPGVLNGARDAGTSGAILEALADCSLCKLPSGSSSKIQTRGKKAQNTRN